MSTKDAAHYLANPDELTSLTEEQLEALAYGEEQPAAVQDEVAKATPAPSGDAVVTLTEEPKPDAILARDGKHLIPITVLDSARDAAKTAQANAQAEAAARQAAEQRLAELQAKLDAAQSGDQSSTGKGESMLSQEELAAMQEDFPVIAKTIQAMQDKISQLQSTTSQQDQSKQVAEAEVAARTSQDLIDANPKLSHLQTNDPIGWARAVEIDNQLLNNPATANLPLAERFAKAAAAYEAIYGAVPVPATSQKQPVQESKKPVLPLSMGAIPGGTPPAVDEQSALLAMDGTQATAHFAGMTKEQIERQLDALL